MTRNRVWTCSSCDVQYGDEHDEESHEMAKRCCPRGRSALQFVCECGALYLTMWGIDHCRSEQHDEQGEVVIV